MQCQMSCHINYGMVSYWMSRHVCNADRYSSMHFQSTVNMHRNMHYAKVTRILCMYDIMKGVSMWPSSRDSWTSWTYCVCAGASNPQAFKDFDTVDGRNHHLGWKQTRKKQGTNYLSSGAGFSWTVGFKKWHRFSIVVAGGAFILISSWIWSGAGSVNPGVPKKMCIKRFVFFLKGAHSM